MRRGFSGRDGGHVALALLLALAVAAFAGAGEPSQPGAATAPVAARATWEVRGDAVDARFEAYRLELKAYHAALGEALAGDAPDLREKLKAAAPAVTAYGYGILPEIEPDPEHVAATTRKRAESKSYSWPWTEVRIGDEEKKIRDATAEIARVKTLDAKARRVEWEKLVAACGKLRDTQRNIEEHVHYNRLWQAAIAGERAAYDGSTALHDMVVERQALLDVIEAPDDAAVRAALAKMPLVDAARPREEVVAEFRQREAELGRRIHDVIDVVHPPAYLQVEHPSTHQWVLRVPMNTDIEDEAFLQRFRRSVEKVWSVRDGEEEFRVEVAITQVPLAELYASCSGGSATCTMPKPGEHLDTKAHAARFPRTAAGLTTGAGRPFTIQGVIVLGSGKGKAHVLAHEFGHVLGFRDEYFRGYRDLGTDGFQVMEIVADPGDVMGDPDAGPVRGEMMRRLVAAMGE